MANPVVSSPELLTIPEPADAVPRFEAPVITDEKVPIAATKMPLETPLVGDGIPQEAPLVVTIDTPTAPHFEAPTFSPVTSAGVGGADKVRMGRPPSNEQPRPAFVPVAEVMREVDERVVADEKAAVRDLLENEGALDMRDAVSVSMTVARADGYTYFRVWASAKPRMVTVPKDLVILIDASGSIGKDRLDSCRRHVRSVLRSAMNTGDRFNVVAFRDRYSYCFRAWRDCDAASYAECDRWMSSLAAHGRTDVFDSVASVLTLPRDPRRPLIALMVTDGEANSGISDTAQILAKFTALNDGLISVYMYGVKSAANRTLVGALTRGNRGEGYVHEGWRWKAGEGLDAFSERFRDPVITDLRLQFPTVCPAESYPMRLRNLYRGRPVDIVGRVRGNPSEIVFLLRGIAGATAYDGFFRLPVASANEDATLPGVWRSEREADRLLH